MLPRGNLSRRGFLQRSLAALTVGAGLPAWFARELIAADDQTKAQKPIGPNDKIIVGAIGIGSPKSRGTQIIGLAKKLNGVQFTAVCDVDKAHRGRAAKLVGPDCKVFSDFRELLDLKDINAVQIATPDHWHALIAIDAMRKGKDVYCEKPLTLTVAEGQAMAKVAKETGRIVQVGTQQRTEYSGKFRLAAELVRAGRIGKVKTVHTRVGPNPKNGPFMVTPVPEGLDWDFWLGPTPKVDYVTERCHYEFRWWYEYSGGKMTDWGAHMNDIAQWGLGMDASGPIAVEGEGEAPAQEPNCYNCHYTFKATYTYAGGVQLFCIGNNDEAMVRFEGEDGTWIQATRKQITASDPKLIKAPLKDGMKLYESEPASHYANFIECVRSRKQPICPTDVGHRSASVCHIGNIAIRTGKKLKWDPVREVFDDAEANKMLSRDYRAPWKL